MEEQKFDIAIIGGGPGGYVAAIRAAQLGANVVLIEDKHLGGICLNYGCIPTKALLKISELNHSFKEASSFGFTVGKVSFDLAKVVKRSRDVAQKLSAGISHLMKKNKITVIDGRGKINGANNILVTKDKKKIANIKANNIIIATGARARALPGIQIDNEQIVTYKEAMLPKTLPTSLLVVGSGAIGIEFASFYQNMGSQVTLIELQDNILPVEDKEIAKLAHKAFVKQGMEIYTKTKIKSLNKLKDKIDVILDNDGKEIKLSVERIIIATGIIANTEDLGLETIEVDLEKNHIVTNEYNQTKTKNIYAIGDVTKGPWLAHKASHEGVLVAEHIMGKKVKAINNNNIPGCTYCRPQIASVGLTEEKALSLGYEINVGRFSYSANGKAIAIDETYGLVKTIFAKDTGELLGAHIIGADATEMINGYLVGKELEATIADFKHVIFPHPTLSEMMHESVLDALNQSLHQ